MYFIIFVLGLLFKDILSATITFDYSKGEATATCPGSNPTWDVDGGGVSAGSKYDISGQTLTIKQLRKADITKTYKCTSGSTTTFDKNVLPYLYQVDYLMITTSEGYLSEIACYLLVGTESTSAAAQTITWNWYTSGGPITSGNRYSIESTNTQSKLKINSAVLSDNGIYYCSAANSYGTHSRNTTLRVKSKLTPVWPFLGTLFEGGVLVLIIFGVQYLTNKRK